MSLSVDGVVVHNNIVFLAGTHGNRFDEAAGLALGEHDVFGIKEHTQRGRHIGGHLGKRQDLLFTLLLVAADRGLYRRLGGSMHTLTFLAFAVDGLVHGDTVHTSHVDGHRTHLTHHHLVGEVGASIAVH